MRDAIAQTIRIVCAIARRREQQRELFYRVLSFSSPILRKTLIFVTKLYIADSGLKTSNFRRYQG